MKKLLYIFLAIFIGFNIIFSDFDYIEDRNKIAPTDINNVIFEENLPEEGEDAIRQGTYEIMQGTNLKNPGKIENSDQAQEKTLKYIQNIVNYLLGFLGLVTLIYLLVHGFMMVTAAGDEDKFKKGLGGLKIAVLALLGIGLSWFIISLIIYVIQISTTTN